MEVYAPGTPIRLGIDADGQAIPAVIVGVWIEENHVNYRVSYRDGGAIKSDWVDSLLVHTATPKTKIGFKHG